MKSSLHSNRRFSGSFSAQALSAAGAAPGATIKAGGLCFTWPTAAAGSNDNAVANGQIITVSGSGTLGLLISGSQGTATGTGTITYSDGTTQSYTPSPPPTGSPPPRPTAGPSPSTPPTRTGPATPGTTTPPTFLCRPSRCPRAGPSPVSSCPQGNRPQATHLCTSSPSPPTDHRLTASPRKPIGTTVTGMNISYGPRFAERTRRDSGQELLVPTKQPPGPGARCRVGRAPGKAPGARPTLSPVSHDISSDPRGLPHQRPCLGVCERSCKPVISQVGGVLLLDPASRIGRR